MTKSTTPAAGRASAPEAVDHFFRHEWAKVVSYLTGRFGTAHLAAIEDAVQDALEKAMLHWPYHGVPDSPTAWMLTVARNKLIDGLRRESRQVLATQLPELPVTTPASDWDQLIKDDQLSMMFACCHPLLSMEHQIVLTLRILGGFGRREIASALLKKEETVAKALQRAKQKLREARVQMEVPAPGELPRRLEVVLKVLYLLFNEGYKASEGDQLLKKDLCLEAIRLNALLLDKPETRRADVAALQALMYYQASRLDARQSSSGYLLTLEEQDRSTWDQEMIAHGDVCFAQAREGGQQSEYLVQAAMAGLHSHTAHFEQTDWKQLLSLYDGLLAIKPSPLVFINSAIPYGKVYGAEAALRLLGHATADAALQRYYGYYAIKAYLLLQAGQVTEAAALYRKAATLTDNAAEQAYLQHKADTLSHKKSTAG